MDCRFSERRMGKGSPWSDEEVKALLNIRAEVNIQEQLERAVRNKAVFERISKQLKEAGYNKESPQCRAKIKNLKTLYKRVKDNNGRSERGRKVCKFYDEIDAILGLRPATRPPVVIESLNDGEQYSSESGSDEDSKNVSFRNENEKLERPVNDNQIGASVDDESASVLAEHTETE